MVSDEHGGFSEDFVADFGSPFVSVSAIQILLCGVGQERCYPDPVAIPVINRGVSTFLLNHLRVICNAIER